MKKRDRKRAKHLLEVFDTVLLMKDLSSLEHYALGGGVFRPVLDGIALEVGKGESWTVYGESPFDLKLLLEIAGNMRPFEGGRRILFKEEVESRTGSLMESVFYIDDADMLPPQMNVLESVMFATGKEGGDPVLRQDGIFEGLIDLGLGQLSLTPVSRLTREEKAVVTLLIAAYSDSDLIVLNLPDYDFPDPLIEAMAGVFQHGTREGKALIWASRDSLAVERTGSHTAYLHEGRLIYSGRVEELLARYDKTLLLIEDERAQDLVEPLTRLLPRHRIRLEEEGLSISDLAENKTDPVALQAVILQAGFQPRQVTMNHKTAQRAFRALAGAL